MNLNPQALTFSGTVNGKLVSVYETQLKQRSAVFVNGIFRGYLNDDPTIGDLKVAVSYALAKGDQR